MWKWITRHQERGRPGLKQRVARRGGEELGYLPRTPLESRKESRRRNAKMEAKDVEVEIVKERDEAYIGHFLKRFLKSR